MAIARPTSLILGALVAVVTESFWGILVGAVVYLGIVPVTAAIRRRGDDSLEPSDVPRSA